MPHSSLNSDNIISKAIQACQCYLEGDLKLAMNELYFGYKDDNFGNLVDFVVKLEYLIRLAATPAGSDSSGNSEEVLSENSLKWKAQFE